jgi:hypothetical protein
MHKTFEVPVQVTVETDNPYAAWVKVYDLMSYVQQEDEDDVIVGYKVNNPLEAGKVTRVFLVQKKVYAFGMDRERIRWNSGRLEDYYVASEALNVFATELDALEYISKDESMRKLYPVGDIFVKELEVLGG